MELLSPCVVQCSVHFRGHVVFHVFKLTPQMVVMAAVTALDFGAKGVYNMYTTRSRDLPRWLLRTLNERDIWSYLVCWQAY